MATAIRVIPTLHGEEARKFIERAEWVEAHPGGMEVSKAYIQKNEEFCSSNGNGRRVK